MSDSWRSDQAVLSQVRAWLKNVDSVRGHEDPSRWVTFLYRRVREFERKIEELTGDDWA